MQDVVVTVRFLAFKNVIFYLFSADDMLKLNFLEIFSKVHLTEREFFWKFEWYQFCYWSSTERNSKCLDFWNFGPVRKLKKLILVLKLF